MGMMKDLYTQAEEALTAYAEYDAYYDNGDYDHDETCENLRATFIEAAVDVLMEMTGRKPVR